MFPGQNHKIHVVPSRNFGQRLFKTFHQHRIRPCPTCLLGIIRTVLNHRDMEIHHLCQHNHRQCHMAGTADNQFPLRRHRFNQ